MTQDSMLDHKSNCKKDISKSLKRRKNVKLKPTKKIKLEIGESEHKCDHDQCGKVFNSKRNLDVHKITYYQYLTAAKQCLEVIKMKSKDKSKYLLDVDLDPKDGKDGIEKYKCEECGMFAKSRKGMQSHKKRFHSGMENIQKCFICPDVVPFKMMTEHMLGKHRMEFGRTRFIYLV